MFAQRQRQQRGGLGILLLLMQLYQVGFDRIPPVTLATIAANSCIFLRVFRTWNLPSVQQACVSTFYVWHRKQWTRLFWGSLFHLDEWHLYYNMVSFLWKGLSLERKCGSAYFAYMLAVFSGLTNVTLVGLNMLAEHIFEDSSYISICSAGFSGVIFALKVVTTNDLPPGIQHVMGLFPVPTRLVVWAELLIIQLLIPNASFTGHLAGILVGLSYVKGPLKIIMDTFMSPGTGRRRRQFGASYTYQSGTSGEQTRATPTQNQHSEYTGGLSEEEQLDRALWESRLQNNASPRTSTPLQSNNTRSQPKTNPSNQEQNLPSNPPSTPHHSTHPQSELDNIRKRRLARFT